MPPLARKIVVQSVRVGYDFVSKGLKKLSLSTREMSNLAVGDAERGAPKCAVQIDTSNFGAIRRQDPQPCKSLK